MKIALIILIVFLGLFDYALMVMAKGADRKAEEMYQRHKGRHE